MAGTLFGPEEEVRKPRTPPAESVVRELVRLGVKEATARGFDNRQSRAVLDKLRADEKAREDDAAAFAERKRVNRDNDWQPGRSELERFETAAHLLAVGGDPGADPGELLRAVRSGAAELTEGQLRRLCVAMSQVLREGR